MPSENIITEVNQVPEPPLKPLFARKLRQLAIKEEWPVEHCSTLEIGALDQPIFVIPRRSPSCQGAEDSARFSGGWQRPQ